MIRIEVPVNIVGDASSVEPLQPDVASPLPRLQQVPNSLFLIVTHDRLTAQDLCPDLCGSADSLVQSRQTVYQPNVF